MGLFDLNKEAGGLFYKYLAPCGWPRMTNPRSYTGASDLLSFIRITARKCSAYESGKGGGGIRGHRLLPQPSFSSHTCLLSWNYFKEVLPTSQLPFMWDKAQVCVNSCERDTLETGLSDRAEGDAWRCSRRVPRKGREILPVADSDGANSSTKDRQTRGQPALYLSFFRISPVFLCLFTSLWGSVF